MIRAVLTPEQTRENELHAAWAAGRMSGRLEALSESANKRAEHTDGISRPTEPSVNPYKKHGGQHG